MQGWLIHREYKFKYINWVIKLNKKMILIAGPCVIESEKMVMELAEKLKNIIEDKQIDFYFKASFDKANRTSINSYRGPGLEEGLRILEKVKCEYGHKIITDIHEPYQADLVKDICDIIQIPAFLCRQTDLLVAAAKTGKIINVKKGQFLAPWDMKNVIEKIKQSGNDNIMLCERGTSFGYNRLVVDMTSIVEMKKFGYSVIFDGTHSVQKPGGNGTSTSGNREYVPYLCKAAVAVGADGLFLETHMNPDAALSDGPNMIRIDEMRCMLEKCLEIFKI
jgi:2-dehydro-3-deoxyphosphooctonate aldolase (KDO 8-P synthase)